jgi:S-disulfanyl-L-cysteine oxidoreductase SoxD
MANQMPTRPHLWRVRLVFLALGFLIGMSKLSTSVQAQDKQGQSGTTPSKMTIYDGVFTVEQAESGRRIYAEGCQACHGPTAGGAQCPNLIGPVINNKYAGIPLSAYYAFMQTNMPKGNPGSLGDQDYADIMAFILKMHGANPGEHRLTPDQALLDNIVMGPKPPKDAARAAGGVASKTDERSK